MSKRPRGTKKGESSCGPRPFPHQASPVQGGTSGLGWSPYLGPLPMIMQDSPWLPLPSRRNPGSSEGRPHPPWSGPHPALPTSQPGQFTCPAHWFPFWSLQPPSRHTLSFALPRRSDWRILVTQQPSAGPAPSHPFPCLPASL